MTDRPAFSGESGVLAPPRERSEPVALEGLSESELKLRGIIALAVDAIVSTDDEFRVTLFNTGAERIFGYSADELIGQPLDVLLPEASRAAHRGHLAQFAASERASREMGERGQIWGRRKSGELFPADASISKIRLGDTMHFTVVLRDVTQTRRLEHEREALLLRERQARADAESAERRIAFLARAGDLLHASLAPSETFTVLVQLIVPELARYCIIDVMDEAGAVSRIEVAHADASKKELADRLHAYPRSQTACLTSGALRTGEPELIAHVTDELLVSWAADAEHLAILRALAPTSLMIVPLQARMQVLGAIVFARDATSRPYDASDLALAAALAQRAAGALDNAQLYQHAQRAVRARDDVLAVVSHDLRNPLSVISMCATSLLTNGFGDEVRSREAIRTVRQSAQWAQRLIQDLLDVTSIGAGGLSLRCQLEDPVLLAARAAHVFEELVVERSIVLKTELPDVLPLVLADADRMLQAMGNLIGNAVTFTPAGGTIVVGAALDGTRVHLFVADSGPGVPAEDIPHVFDRYWTARRGARGRGTGMGLAIVRGIMDAHGGEALVEPNPTGGARFVLALPVAHGDSGPPDARAGGTLPTAQRLAD